MTNLRVPDLNKVLIAGRLTRDPELRYTASNKPWCRFGIANTRYFKDGNGERKEDTTFADCVAWGAQAEFIAEKLGKGRPVLIDGSLSFSEWETDGQKRSKLEVNCQRVTPLDWDNDGQTTEPQAAQPTAAPEAEQQALPEDDIPF